jgi:hypothetical protein
MSSPRPFLSRVGAAGASLAALLALALGASGPAAPAAPAAPAPAPAPQDGFGTIKGRLVWGGDKAPEQPKITANQQKDPQVCAKEDLYERDLVVDPETKGVRFAFTYLPAPKGKNPEAEKALLEEHPRVEIDQVSCQFVPYAAAGTTKQEWVFKSSDAAGHNVHYQGFVNSANFALPPNGEATKKLNPDKRPTPLVCDIHPWMKGYILTLDHPFFAVTGEDGSFEITGVPAGKQNLVIWQSKAGFVNKGGLKGMEVEVKPGETVDLGEVVLTPEMVKGK